MYCWFWSFKDDSLVVEGQGEGEGQGQRVLVFGLRSVSGCRWLLRCVAGQQPPASEIESAGVGRGGGKKKEKSW